ncbi:hypothetical protein HNP99_000793 [Flavobacterium sp. 28A]|uniref:hypothetical protein n=1 Tax=Flavobacterium sp. 28A TaxID=2735895 RepID=UPI00156F0B20|nr:hypothetical protein [Flavobacterium sp. 28A]NRT14453.1 hypothetical protein [Flavobacterium sp. 28A]
MKKTIFLFVALLMVSAAQAKYIKAILYMNDGSQKKGLAEMVEYKDSNVRFKADENAKSEKFSSSLINKIEYPNESGFITTMEFLYLTSANGFSGKFSNAKNKFWFNIIYDNGVKIGQILDKGSMQTNNFRATNTSYYFGNIGDENLVFGFNSMGNVIKKYASDSTIKKMSKVVFVNCSNINEAIENKTFKLETALDQLITIFDKIKCK